MQGQRRTTSILVPLFVLAVVGLIIGPVRTGRAAEFPVAGPAGEGTWGSRPNQPIAPNDPGFADEAFRPDQKGPQWLASYVAEVLALRPAVDAARAHRWYALPPPDVLALKHGIRPGPPDPGVVRQLEDKQSQDTPTLLAELDGRFATLAAAAGAATAITLPPETQVAGGPVTYCDWIGGTATPPSSLSRTLLARCLADRDAYLDQLVRRMAELALLPVLPAPSPLPGFQLSRAIIPADRPPPVFDYQARNQAYRATIGRRLDAGYPALARSLQDAVERLASQDTIRSPDAECAAILGGYAAAAPGPSLDPLLRPIADRLNAQCHGAIADRATGRLTRARAAMTAELQAALQDARDNPVIPPALDPDAKCHSVLGRFLEFESPFLVRSPLLGMTADQSKDLQASCRTTVALINQATDARRAEAKVTPDRATGLVVDRLVAANLAKLPSSDDVATWKAANWFPVPPGSGMTADETAAIAAVSRGVYQARWDAGTAAPRKSAVIKMVGQIDQAFLEAGDTESPLTATLCAGQARPQGDRIMGEALGIAVNPAAARKASEALRGAPGVSAAQAGTWVTTACRADYDRMAMQRLADAGARAHTEAVFTGGITLWVRTPDGELQRFDPAQLVRDAAVDGVQVTFTSGTWLRSSTISITPIGRSEPQLLGSLSELTRADGVKGLEVSGLPSLPGLDGPAATLTCFALPAEQTAQEGLLIAGAGIAGAVVTDHLGSASRIVQDGFDKARVAAACQAAKSAFLQGGK